MVRKQLTDAETETETDAVPDADASVLRIEQTRKAFKKHLAKALALHHQASTMGTKNLWSYSHANQRKLEDVKRQLCRAIRKAARNKKYSRREWAMYMGTSKAIISSIENDRVHRLTCNQLFHYLVYLEPNFELLISI